MTEELNGKIEKILQILREDLGTIRTGRATPQLVENIVISAYGGTARLKLLELATVGVTDATTVVITPFDVSIIGEIQKGIEVASTGLTPVIDGQIIRISIPPLSQERREELIKLMKHKLENGRIMVRQARHEAMTVIKKQHDEKEIGDDEKERLEKEIQKKVDSAVEKIEDMGKQKEEELLQI